MTFDIKAEIGLIGTGRMGRPIAECLLKAGRRLAVFDRDLLATSALASSQCSICPSAADVANKAPIVLACVPSIEAFDDCTLGNDGLVHGSAIRVYVHLGTTGPRNVIRIAEQLSARGIATLDAPISGGMGRAAAGTLSSMISGSGDAIDRASEAIRLYSSSLTVVGDAPGAAQIAKLINNMLSAANLAAAIEGLIVASKANVDISALTEVLLRSTGGSYAFETKIVEQVLTRQFNFGGALRIIRKDMEAWREMIEDFGLACPIGSEVHKTYMRAMEQLDPDDDMTSIAKYYETLEGVAIPKVTIQRGKS